MSIKYHKQIPFLFCILFIFLATNSLLSQNFIIKGKVIDSETGEAVPFANVYPKSDTKLGTNTDFDGYYTIKIPSLEDSIVVSYIGYVKKTKALNPKLLENNTINLNFQLEPENTKLEEIVIKAGEDPSYPIMRKVLANKHLNDKRRLRNYEYESYVKIEMDVDNIHEKLSKKKIVQKVQATIDSTGGGLTGEDGKPLIPLFLSETISRYYYQGNPEKIKEDVIKSKVEGIGFGDNYPISQILGSSFQEYNFYKNWLKIIEKDFVSPIADGWKLHYDYYLEDSLYVGEHWCYQIEIVPKREQDLAFEGRIWIDSKTYALKQIDASAGRKANINFIEKVKIQQELAPTEEGAWLPVKTRVLIDVKELTNKSAGILAKFYVSNKDIILGKTYNPRFFNERIEMQQDYNRYDEAYWAKQRHDSLTPAELKTYALIDTINQIPIIKTYSEILSVVNSGYFTAGPIDFGNYAYTYAWNDVEGHRFRLGVRTNARFSRLFELKGYGAYGISDKKWKYSARLRFIPSRKRWTELGAEHSYDITQVAVNPDGVNIPAAYLSSLNFFNVSQRSPFYKTETNFFVQSDLVKGFTQTVRFRNAYLEQIGQHFAYFKQTEGNEPVVNTNYTFSELIFETRLARDEQFFYIGNNRISLGTRKLPVLTLRYTYGMKGVWGGEFNYHKFAINLEQDLRLGILGNTYYSLTGFYTASQLPYPLQEIHLGNRGYFYNFYGFILMNYLEFVSNQHVTLNMEHNFNGLIANRIPLLKRLKLRTFIAGNLLTGGLSTANRSLIPETHPGGNTIVNPLGLKSTPYIELGYGISNIFKFFRVTFVHRVNYLQNPDVRKFGVFFSARFQL